MLNLNVHVLFNSPSIKWYYISRGFSVNLIISIIAIMDAAEAVQLVPEKYRIIYQQKWRTIKETVKRGRLSDVYHYPLFENNNEEIISKAEDMLSHYTGRIKVNVAFGFVLEDRTTQELKFFHPSNNTMMFPTPRLLHSLEDFIKFKSDIDQQDAYGYARKNRPSTKWIVSRVICVRFDVYRL